MCTKMFSSITIVLLALFVSVLNSSPFTFLQKDSKLSSVSEDCTLCKTIARKLEKILSESQSVECVAFVTADLCNKLNRFPPDVCVGIGNEYAPSLLYALQNKIFNPDYLCGTLIEGCSDDKDFEMWNVTFPDVPKPPVQKPVLPPANTKTFRVVHLSDIHFDKNYTPGTEADCDEPLCCRPQFNSTEKNIPAGYWGTSAKCDMPIWTLENLFEHLRNNETWDWMLWTGDMPPHDIWEQTKDDQISTLNTVYGLLYKYLYDKQIYLAVGNHESAPCNSFPPHHPNVPPEYDISWLYNQLAANWSNWVSNVGDTQKDIKQIASYVTQVMPGLRLISLNTQYCDEGNFWLYANQTDPDGSLAWLIQQLQSAEDSKEKVHIIGHVPSGDHTCLRFWSANYYDIINRYENTIAGLFFGHTHSDQFAVFYENADRTARPTEVMYVAPSVTTFSWRMPTYRVYTVDSLSFEILDHETYMLNLTEANFTNKTEWTLEYRATESYGLNSLFAEDWNNLINTFTVNQTMFDTYYRHFDRNDKVCDDSCQYDRLCEMRSGRSHDKNNLCNDLPYYPNRTLEVSQSEPRSILIDIPPECLATNPSSTTAATSSSSASTTTETSTKGANSLKTHFHYEIINLFFLFIFAIFLRA